MQDISYSPDHDEQPIRSHATAAQRAMNYAEARRMAKHGKRAVLPSPQAAEIIGEISSTWQQ